MKSNYLFWLKHRFIRIFGKLTWLRLGLRYRLFLPKKYQDDKFIVPFFGYKYQGSLADYIDRFVFYFGAYEREELSLLKKYLKKDAVVFDVGANTGHHALFFSRFAKQVYAFEPYDQVADIMRSRIEYNQIKNISIYNFGLGKQDQLLDFFAPQGTNKGAGSFVSSELRENIGKLQIKKGDSIVQGLNLSSLDLIKIDVEGAEVDVIEGLADSIKKFRPVIFVEMNSVSQLALDGNLSAILKNYDFYIINANNPFFYFFNKPGCKLEKFKPSQAMQNILCIPLKI